MADRHWVGGTENWDATAGLKWSLTDGGAGGQTVPGTSDDVFFDTGSGASVVTIAASSSCLSLTCVAGFTGTIAGASSLTCRGNITLIVGMNWTHTGAVSINTNSSSITSAGKTFGGNFTVTLAGLTFAILDNFICAGIFTATSGTFNTNGFTMTASNFSSNNANVRAINITNSTITLTGVASIWNLSTTTNLTFTSTGSAIKIINGTLTGKTFIGGGLTYNLVWIATGFTGDLLISNGLGGVGSVFGELKDDAPGAHSITFTEQSFQTFTIFNVNGALGALISIKSAAPGVTPATISKSSGTVTVSYLNITDSAATGGAIWDASNGTNVDGGGNTGWLFSSTPVGGGGCECR